MKKITMVVKLVVDDDRITRKVVDQTREAILELAMDLDACEWRVGFVKVEGTQEPE